MNNNSGIVIKLSGNSMLFGLESIVKKILDQIPKQSKLYLICSALNTNYNGITRSTTTELIHCVKSSIRTKGSSSTKTSLDDLFEQYYFFAKSFFADEQRMLKIKMMILSEKQKTLTTLKAINTLKQNSAKSIDLVMGVGEKLSTQIITLALEEFIECEIFNLEDIFEENLDEDLNTIINKLETKLATIFNTPNEKLPVITGFFGYLNKGLINTFGRKYTDVLSVVIAKITKIDKVKIYGNIDGIYSGDPSYIKDGYILKEITSDEASELTYYNTEYLNPIAIKYASQNNITLNISNLSNNGEGTTVTAVENIKTSTRGLATSISIKSNISLINIKSNRLYSSHKFMSSVFKVLQEQDISPQLITTSESQISIAISTPITKDKIDELTVTATHALRLLGSVQILHKMSILSAVGENMKNKIGIAHSMFKALSTDNINIEAISQGSSEINISCLVSLENIERAAECLHENLIGARVC